MKCGAVANRAQYERWRALKRPASTTGYQNWAQEELDSDEFWDHTDSDEGEDEDEKAMYSFTAEQKANYLATVAAARARHQTTIARLMSEKEESNLKVKQLESRIERLEAERRIERLEAEKKISWTPLAVGLWTLALDVDP